jgi:hypothetical protein
VVIVLPSSFLSSVSLLQQLEEENTELKAEVARLAAILQQHGLVPPSDPAVSSSGPVRLNVRGQGTIRITTSASSSSSSSITTTTTTTSATAPQPKKKTARQQAKATTEAIARSLEAAVVAAPASGTTSSSPQLPSSAASLASYSSSFGGGNGSSGSSSSSSAPSDAILFDDDDDEEDENENGDDEDDDSRKSQGVAKPPQPLATRGQQQQQQYVDDDDNDDFLGFPCGSSSTYSHLNPLLVAPSTSVVPQQQQQQQQQQSRPSLELPPTNPLLLTGLSSMMSLPSPGRYFGSSSSSSQQVQVSIQQQQQTTTSVPQGGGGGSRGLATLPLPLPLPFPMLLPPFPGPLSLTLSNSVYGPGETFMTSSTTTTTTINGHITATATTTGGSGSLAGVKRPRPPTDDSEVVAEKEEDDDGGSAFVSAAATNKRARTGTLHTQDHVAAAATGLPDQKGQEEQKDAGSTIADPVAAAAEVAVVGVDGEGGEEGSKVTARKLLTRQIPIHTVLFLSFAFSLAVVMKPGFGEVHYDYDMEGHVVEAAAAGTARGSSGHKRLTTSSLRGSSGASGLWPRGRLLLEVDQHEHEEEDSLAASFANMVTMTSTLGEEGSPRSTLALGKVKSTAASSSLMGTFWDRYSRAAGSPAALRGVFIFAAIAAFFFLVAKRAS